MSVLTVPSPEALDWLATMGEDWEKPEPASTPAPETAAATIARVAAAYGRTPADVTGPSRLPVLVVARSAVAHELRAAGRTLAAIGAALGNRHHTTVLHLLESVPPGPVGECDGCGGPLWSGQGRWCGRRCRDNHMRAQWRARNPDKDRAIRERARLARDARKDELNARRRERWANDPEYRRKDAEYKARAKALRPPRPEYAVACDVCGGELVTTRKAQVRHTGACREADSRARWAEAGARWAKANPEKAKEVNAAAGRRYLERKRAARSA